MLIFGRGAFNYQGLYQIINAHLLYIRFNCLRRFRWLLVVFRLGLLNSVDKAPNTVS